MTTEAPHVPNLSVRVRLYVAGESPNSMAAVANLRAAIAEHPQHPIHLEIIDVLSHPERGLDDGVLVTPVLVRYVPPPDRRVLGNLRNRSMLLAALGIVELT